MIRTIALPSGLLVVAPPHGIEAIRATQRWIDRSSVHERDEHTGP